MKLKFRITGELIRAARTKRGMTQLELANALGSTPQFICNLERGAAPIPDSKLKIFMTTLKIPKKTLLDTIARQEKENLKCFL